MSNFSRSNYDTALLAQLAAVNWGVAPNQATWTIPPSMHFRPWDGQAKVDSTDQPCLFLRRISEEVVQQRAYGANKYVLHYEAWIYARVDNIDITDNPYAQLNPIIDAVDSQITPQPPFDRNTLSGLVDNCRIAGSILIADGIDNGQAVIRIPIDVFTGV
jgi:hypothetical protein